MQKTKDKTFSIITLGCFRNTYDSEIIAKGFLNDGFKYIEFKDRVDLLIINTCGFIEDAKKESIEVIREAIDLKKAKRIKKILVYGCLVQRYKKELENYFKDIDNWSGVLDFNLKFLRRKKLTPKGIEFIKIQEGCINRCSYCAIPVIKGTLKSKPKDEIIKEVKFLDKESTKELNIIGQDITSWGMDLDNTLRFSSLLKDILKVIKNIRWIRLLYTHPRHIDDNLIDLIANEERICKYIDLPIQHINDRILKLMNRNITKKEIISLIERLRKKIKDLAIRTTLIVGFPTETKREFDELVDFVKEIEFERLGAFIYSREEKTKAYNLKPQISKKEKQNRFDIIMSIQREISEKLNKRFIGKELDVFIQEKEDSVYIGRSQYDAYDIDGVVYLKNSNDIIKLGDFYKAKIIDSFEYDLLGVCA